MKIDLQNPPRAFLGGFWCHFGRLLTPRGAQVIISTIPGTLLVHFWTSQSDPKLVFFGVLFLRCLPAVFFDALGAQFGPPNLSQTASKMKPTSKLKHVDFAVIYYTFA